MNFNSMRFIWYGYFFAVFTAKKSILGIWLSLLGVNDIFYKQYFSLVQVPNLKPGISYLLRYSFILITNIPDFLSPVSYLYLYMHMKQYYNVW